MVCSFLLLSCFLPLSSDAALTLEVPAWTRLRRLSSSSSGSPCSSRSRKRRETLATAPPPPPHSPRFAQVELSPVHRCRTACLLLSCSEPMGTNEPPPLPLYLTFYLSLPPSPPLRDFGRLWSWTPATMACGPSCCDSAAFLPTLTSPHRRTLPPSARWGTGVGRRSSVRTRRPRRPTHRRLRPPAAAAAAAVPGSSLPIPGTRSVPNPTPPSRPCRRPCCHHSSSSSTPPALPGPATP